jgi:hypothetical protein
MLRSVTAAGDEMGLQLGAAAQVGPLRQRPVGPNLVVGPRVGRGIGAGGGPERICQNSEHVVSFPLLLFCPEYGARAMFTRLWKNFET